MVSSRVLLLGASVVSSFVPSSSERLSVVSEDGVTSWSLDGLKSDTPGVFVPVSPYTLGGACLT
jgi:hypothetical protein